MSNTDYNMAHGLAKNFISAAYYQHLNGKREQLINACANHLKETKGCSLAFGIKVAIQEIAALKVLTVTPCRYSVATATLSSSTIDTTTSDSITR